MIKAMADYEPAKDEQSATARDYDRWLAEDSLGARWARFWFSPKRTLWMNTPVRGLPKILSIKPEDRILDIGCGYGGLLMYLNRQVGFTNVMEGLDCSGFMIARAQEEIRSRKLEGRVCVRQGLATRLPYAANTFDIAFSTFVIKHLSDALLRDMFREVLRVLKPGGRFCVWDAAPSRYAFMQFWNLILLRTGVSVIHLRSPQQLAALLEEAGFASLRPYGGGPYYYYPPLPRAGFIAVSSTTSFSDSKAGGRRS
jgi:ubiquinone/menaquinone biosynthesis C-methylase UbiE